MWPQQGAWALLATNPPWVPGGCGAHRDDIGNAAVQVALVILNGDRSVLLDPLHGEWAVQLRGQDAVGTGPHGPGPFTTAPTPPTSCSLSLLTHTELAAEFINGADFCALNLPEGGFVLDQEPGTGCSVPRERDALSPRPALSTDPALPRPTQTQGSLLEG